MIDSTYKVLVTNDYMKVYFSKEYGQFIVVDTIEDSESVYTLEEFNLFEKALKLI